MRKVLIVTRNERRRRRFNAANTIVAINSLDLVDVSSGQQQRDKMEEG